MFLSILLRDIAPCSGVTVGNRSFKHNSMFNSENKLHESIGSLARHKVGGREIKPMRAPAWEEQGSITGALPGTGC